MNQTTEGPLQPYEPIRSLADSLFCVDGEWFDTPFKRRMTVIRTRGAQLWIHSPIRMAEADMKRLEDLGEVSWIISPNSFHNSETPWYASRFPNAQVLVPEKIRAKMSRRTRISGSLERDWPLELNAEIRCIPIEGLRLGESAFVHLPSQTLILTDLAFNLGPSAQGMLKKFLSWNQIYDRFGPSRIFRWVFLANRPRFRESIARISELPFDRVIVSHGSILETGAKRKFIDAFSSI